MKASVAITKCQDYTDKNLDAAIKEVTEAVALPEVKGKTVLVKPNILSDASPESCITTNPEFVRSVIKLLKEKGAEKIYVGDSPGIPGPSFCGEKCGIHAICLEENVTWVNFSDNPVNTEISGTRQTLPIAAIVHKVDYVFSVCKMKTHQLMYSTGSVKNLFGVIPGLHKSPCHLKNPSKESFAKLIVGICETVRPAYCLMDAIIAMEGPGPANGSPKPVNLVLASNNAYALDYVQAIVMGYNPQDIPILNEAKRRNLLPEEIDYPVLNANNLIVTDYKLIQIKKKTNFFSTLIVPYFTRGLQKKRQKKNPAPIFVKEKCIGCLKCVQICPAQVLQYNRNEKKIIIDETNCLRCYCCHEMCPQDAISVGATDK